MQVPDWLIILWSDIKNSILSVETNDLARPSFFALWIAIVALPLRGIDRRDPIAGLVYILYCMAAGAALLYALPQYYIQPPSLKAMNVTVCVMGIVAGVRWFYGAQPPQRITGNLVHMKENDNGDGQ